MITITLDDINLINTQKFEMEVDRHVIIIRIPIHTSSNTMDKIIGHSRPTKGYPVKLNGILLGHFHIVSLFPIAGTFARHQIIPESALGEIELRANVYDLETAIPLILTKEDKSLIYAMSMDQISRNRKRGMSDHSDASQQLFDLQNRILKS